MRPVPAVSNPTDMERELQRTRKARAEFVRRVREEEQLANRDPKGYRRRVFGLIGLAYGYIFAVLLLALASVGVLVYLMINAGSGNSLYIRLAFFDAIFVFAILRSLWVKLEPPDGVILKRQDAPELYKEVDAIADKLQAPRPDDIRIDFRVNAAASQTPRLGMFGWYRNTLVLGLPLLMSLSPDEARAVIAHEFGHFSGSHGKFGSWAYRVDCTWSQMWKQFSRGHVYGAWLFVWFVRWFQPRFAATTFALRRANEYEADRAAAEIAGSSNMAHALMRLTYLGSHVNKSFWEKLNDRTRELPAPPLDAFNSLEEAAAQTPDHELVFRRISNALREPTDFDDTHPSLADRLASLSETPSSESDAVAAVEKPPELNAAQILLGPRVQVILTELGEKFAKANKAKWERQHREFLEEKKSLERLREQATQAPLSENDSLDLAYFTFHVDGPDAAEPMFRNLHMLFPANSTVTYWLGHILALKGDLDAEPLLRKVMAENPKYSRASINLLGQLYWTHGENEKLAELREEAVEHQTTGRMTEAHARTLQLGDDLEVHDLTAEQVARIVEQLPAVPKLQVAYLVCKVLPNGQRRLTMIAFHKAKAIERGNEQHLLVAELLKVHGLPRGTMVFSPKERKNWIKRLDKIPGAKVYERNARPS